MPATMFTVEILDVYGTGAGYGAKPHQYFNCKGRAMSKSPKRAWRQAQRQANLCEGAEWIPVLSLVKMWRGSQLILDKVR